MARATTAILPGPPASEQGGNHHPGLRQVLGEADWQELPRAVRARFADGCRSVDYVGVFEVVRASALGRVIAQVARLIGTPVVPWVGTNLRAVVHVGPAGGGVAWERAYHRPGGERCLVRSVKVVTPDLQMVERLPAGLCMPLHVFTSRGILHFVSRGYYFRLGLPGGHELHLSLPAWCSPGETHVEHIDEGSGWFRFTMTVTHPRFGEMFYQTGRFHSAREAL